MILFPLPPSFKKITQKRGKKMSEAIKRAIKAQSAGR